MATDQSQIDPTWAWRPFEPNGKRPWNLSLAAHLYRRAGFAATRGQLDEAVKLGPGGALRQLMQAATTGDSAADAGQRAAFDHQMDMMGKTMLGAGGAQQMSAWWLYRMVGTPAQLLEKTTLFWHGHFATSAAKVNDARLMYDQNQLLRDGAQGPFEKTVLAISRDPAMLIWLDSTTNRKIRPNENYAREVMELFCLGVDNYTEKDIKQVARAFTGWEVRNDQFRFNRFQHDTGDKTILGHTGNFNGDDAVRIILEQPAAPRFIARKLARYFVCDEPQLSDAVIEPLAKQLRENGFVTGPVIQRILGSNLFYSEHAIGRKVRSPVEFGVGLVRALEATTDMFALAAALQRLGQGVFFPPSVKGWDGGRTWINSSTLLGRANYARQLVLGGGLRYSDDQGLADVLKRYGVSGPADTVDWLSTLLLAVPVPAAARKTLIAVASDKTGDANQRVGRVVHAICTLPEFQLC